MLPNLKRVLTILFLFVVMSFYSNTTSALAENFYLTETQLKNYTDHAEKLDEKWDDMVDKATFFVADDIDVARNIEKKISQEINALGNKKAGAYGMTYHILLNQKYKNPDIYKDMQAFVTQYGFSSAEEWTRVKDAILDAHLAVFLSGGYQKKSYSPQNNSGVSADVPTENVEMVFKHDPLNMRND